MNEFAYMKYVIRKDTGEFLKREHPGYFESPNNWTTNVQDALEMEIATARKTKASIECWIGLYDNHFGIHIEEITHRINLKPIE